MKPHQKNFDWLDSKTAKQNEARIRAKIRSSLRKASIIIGTIFFAAAAMAQSGQSITGQISDSSGAFIPNGPVIVHNELTGVDIKTVTTDSGTYTVPYIPPGNYDVPANKLGFQSQNKTGLVLTGVAPD